MHVVAIYTTLHHPKNDLFHTALMSAQRKTAAQQSKRRHLKMTSLRSQIREKENSKYHEFREPTEILKIEQLEHTLTINPHFVI